MTAAFKSNAFQNNAFQIGATLTPPAVARGGGTSRRKRSLPQYYSRQIFGERIELPQEPHAHEVAVDVLDQTSSVLEDLGGGQAHAVLLKTVDQLSRIVARQIESRQIYNVIEEARARVQAKMDAEMVALKAISDEEDDVMEILEIL